VERARGEPIAYGDVTDPDALHGAGIERALAVVVVLSDPFASTRAVVHARALAPEVPVFVRTRYRREAERMRALGATEAVAEEIETSLEVLTQLLARLQVPGNVIEAELEALRHSLPTLRPLRAPRARLGNLPTEIGEMPVSTHQLAEGDWAVGRTLVDVNLRVATGVAVIGIRAPDGYLSPPPADRRLEPGDLLYLLGPPTAITAARACLARGPSPQ
jgi:CPA2 family monovalent cation:H+ antiporter-2